MGDANDAGGTPNGPPKDRRHQADAEGGPSRHCPPGLYCQDAEAHVVNPLITLCQEQHIPYEYADSISALGRACGIQVGAAAAAIIQ